MEETFPQDDALLVGDGFVPVLECEGAALSWARVARVFAAHRIVLLKGAARGERRTRWLPTMRELSRRDGGEVFGEGLSAASLVGAAPWYASFVLKDPAALAAALAKLPAPASAIERRERIVPGCRGSESVVHGEHAWCFVGDNRGQSAPLRGRAEHTDALGCDVAGTWHAQLSGSKEWFVRRAEGCQAPSKRPRRSAAAATRDAEPLTVRCERDDLLLIDTRAWRHRTELPANESEISISLARDFAIGTTLGPTDVTNIDATLAAKALEPGDVVLSEHELPDCALARSDDPNCAVAADDHENYFLVAVKAIRVGDELTVAISDSEDDEDDSDDDEAA